LSRLAPAAVLLTALACVPAFGADADKSKPDTAKNDAVKTDPAKNDAVKTEPAKAEQNRKKPLQRCDQLADKAQLDCLEKARERAVEARKKREASGAKSTGARGDAK
jgi:hypothetical protein